MYSKFPFSMENFPRQRRVGCFSLKFAAVVTALIVILYSLLAVAQGLAVLAAVTPGLLADERPENVSAYVIVVCVVVVHAVSFLLSAVMLLGALRERAALIKPWVVWKSVQLLAAVLLFVFWNTMGMLNQFQDTSLLFCAAEFLTIMIRFYMLVLVTSYYKQLLEEQMETERLRGLINSDTWYTEA